MPSHAPRNGGWRLASTIATGTLVAAACGAGHEGDAAPFLIDPAAFGATPPPASRAFDVITSDMDLDGDPDLLVNWHNTGRLELFENVEGAFRLANPADADRSGLFENRGIGDLYGETDEMVARVRASGAPGVYLWHGSNAGDVWDVSIRDGWNVYAVPADEPLRLQITTNCALKLELEERFVRRRGEFSAEVELDTAVHFRTRLDYISTQLKVSTSAPLYVGTSLRAIAGGEVDLWKDDVHGIAWVDVRGTPQPDLFLTRGGLMGALQPPHDPKVDPFFEYGGGDLLYADVRDAIPPGYGRGRRVEWVDIDGDMAAELYIGNTDTPNVLLAAAPTGAYRDIAPQLGLDSQDGEVFAWLDVDGNGLDDLVLIDDAGFEVAYNRGERRFEVRPGKEVGLVFPPGSALEQPEIIDSLSLHLVDQDDDGRLDLWLSGHGAARPSPSRGQGEVSAGAHTLFRADDAGFSDVTAEVGLNGLPDAKSLVLLDFDNDGYCDALSIGPTPLLLRNEAGERFTPLQFAGGDRFPAHARGIALDADGDGLLEVALMGGGRRLARNASTRAGSALLVVPKADGGDPVGTVVTAFYVDGTKQAQRYGSASTTRHSQGLLPLHFGVPARGAVERLEVRWPDARTETRTVLPGQNAIELKH